MPETGERPETRQQPIHHRRRGEREGWTLGLMNELSVTQVAAGPEGSAGHVRQAHRRRDVEQAAEDRRKPKIRRPIYVGLVPIGEDALA